ncbi:glycosyltransferase [Sphingomonas sp. Leaf21]|uniref:glycosyltransferase n=1 Tax=Sphingomonas sp. Leaf21 TaxID=2876550 RepID=UPI001E33562A|nr:glycosyltransferase [Sphingomonas sp. Leaf21]
MGHHDLNWRNLVGEGTAGKTILVFSKIPIAPAFGGNRQRILTMLDELRHRHRVDFVLIPSRQMRDIDLDAHRAFFGDGHFHVMTRGKVAELRFTARILLRRLKARIFGKRLSTDVDALFDRSLEKQCRGLIKTIAPDVVLVEYVHFSKIFEWVPVGTRKLLDTHDSFSHEFTAEAERKGLARADALLAIQEREARLFRDMLGAESGTEIAMVSHIIADQPMIGAPSCEGASFLGSKFEANNLSLAALVENVMPLVLAQRPDFKLHVIGNVGESVPDQPFIVKHGRVEVVAQALVHAPVLANYIVKGSGIKIKMLDAMGMGIPYVSTPLGADGVPADFAHGGVVAQDDQAFADALVALYDDSGKRAAMGKAGLECAGRWNAAQRRALHAVVTGFDPLHDGGSVTTTAHHRQVKAA